MSRDHRLHRAHLPALRAAHSGPFVALGHTRHPRALRPFHARSNRRKNNQEPPLGPDIVDLPAIQRKPERFSVSVRGSISSRKQATLEARWTRRSSSSWRGLHGLSRPGRAPDSGPRWPAGCHLRICCSRVEPGLDPLTRGVLVGDRRLTRSFMRFMEVGRPSPWSTLDSM